MGTISSGIGLISGLETADIIDQLIALQRRPIDMLDARVAGYTQQQTGLVSISAYLATIEGLSTTLADEDTFAARLATSSNESVLTVSAQSGAPLGSYAFTVARLVQTHQMISSGFADTDTATVGAGTISIELGDGFVNGATSVSSLNGQTGIDRGQVRITDRSGASAVIDLTDVGTVADVLDRINSSITVDVTASVRGDAIVVTDNTGETTSNLIVANVGLDATAASLGIAGSVAATEIEGTSLIAIGEATSLRLLNDGNGVRHEVGFDDVRITQRDGTTIDVNVSSAVTVGDVLDAINNDADNTGDLTAQLADDGVSIELVDTSTGATALAVTALNDSQAANDLGLLKSVTGGGGTLSGDRVVAGLNTVLLRTLQGGAGVDRGEIRIVDRAGTESIVDLSDAETVQDVIDLINDAAVAADVTASVNAAGNGVTITDNTGSTANVLIVTNNGGSTTATDLGIDTTDAGVSASTVAGTDLDRQYISEATLLDSLNGGRGITRGTFRITDSTGLSAVVDLTQGNETTIGDVIQEINSRGLNVTASVNATGDGILLTDTGGGAGLLTVAEEDNGATAADLNILGAAETGETTIDGSFEIHVTIEADDTLQDVVTAINNATSAATATIINDGSGITPYRLSLTSAVSGEGGRLLFDAGDTGLRMSTLVEGRDAALLLGTAGAAGEPLLVTSYTNTVSDVIDGVTLNLVSTSASPVTVSISGDSDSIVTRVEQWVTAINAALDGIDELTDFNADTETSGPLQGDITAQRVENKLFDLVTRQYDAGDGTYDSLRDIGISLDENTRLTLDADRLRQVLGNGLTHVTSLFTTADEGIGEYFEDTLHNYTSDNPGLIENRVESLAERIVQANEQKEKYEVRLEAERLRLELEFAQLEALIAQLQDQQNAIGSLQFISASSSSGSRGLISFG